MEKVLAEQKICFIIAVTNREMYQRSLATWQELRVPEGMSVQYIAVDISQGQPVGMAYQLAMGKSDAKYKIYIRQEVELAEEGFLEEAVAIFRQHPEYGMAGAAGSIDLPEEAIWYKGSLAGCICDDHQGKMLGYKFLQGKEAALPVMLLEGGILMTQYDVDWQSPYYDKGELYAASQCLNFRNEGRVVAAWSNLGQGIRHWGCTQPVLEECAQEGRQLISAYKEMVLREQPLVSIIVPVYNAKVYLQECVNSLLAQTYGNLEIILIDDGSTDGSRELMAELYGAQPRVLLLEQECNQGASAARNRGIKEAKGKYLSFVDSDDLADKDYVEAMVLLAEGYQADIAACGVKNLYKDGSTSKYSNNLLAMGGGVPALTEACKFTINLATWGKIVSRKMIEEHKLEFTYDGLEDIIFSFEALYYANKCICISAMKYNYRQVEGSLSKRGLDKHYNYVRTFCSVLFTIKEFMEKIKEKEPVAHSQQIAIYEFFLEVSMFSLNPLFERGEKQLAEVIDRETKARFGEDAIYIETMLHMIRRYKALLTSQQQSQ